jgi:acetoin utilization protein AcuC
MTSAPGHPLAPVRLELTIELARAFGLFAAPGVSSAPAADAEVELVHIRPYIAAVRRCSAGRCSTRVSEEGTNTLS